MAKRVHSKEDESISIIHGREPWERGKKRADSKSIIVRIIEDEIEERDLVFTAEEIIRHAKDHGIPRPEAEAVIDDLIKSRYLRYAHGTQGLLTRNVWRDYGEIEEEYPEF